MPCPGATRYRETDLTSYRTEHSRPKLAAMPKRDRQNRNTASPCRAEKSPHIKEVYRRSSLRSLILAVFVIVSGLSAPVVHASNTEPGSAHRFDFVSIEGDPLPMSTFKGQAVLVVNTASFCGFTHQYKGLQALYDEYRNDGLTVLGIPSDDFGNQEPGSETEIKEFCETHYDITFPMTEKLVVRGQDAHPFYHWAKSKLGPIGVPKWNFHKILVAPDGSAVEGWSTSTPPDAPAVVETIQSVLGLPAK